MSSPAKDSGLKQTRFSVAKLSEMNSAGDASAATAIESPAASTASSTPPTSVTPTTDPASDPAPVVTTTKEKKHVGILASDSSSEDEVDEDEEERAKMMTVYGTQYMKSLRHYLTRDALPMEDHYRNILSFHGNNSPSAARRKFSRPTIEELHVKPTNGFGLSTLEENEKMLKKDKVRGQRSRSHWKVNVFFEFLGLRFWRALS